MNKLSELSKPVAYTDAEELRFHHATSDMWPTPLGFGKDAPLYSQEYVSALLAEMEEVKAANNELRVTVARTELKMSHLLKKAYERAETAEQHIAELERERDTWRDSFDNERVRADKLFARLATPVRLPDIRSDDYHETGWFQHMKYYRDVERSLRAAGFTVGDE